MTTYREATYKQMMATGVKLQQESPLTEATFFIMLSLASEPRHGYAIMKDVEMLSGGRVTLSTGTLYGALKRLLDHSWIKRRTTERPNADSNRPGRPKKEYTLTELGRGILGGEIERLEALVRVAGLRVLGAQP